MNPAPKRAVFISLPSPERRWSRLYAPTVPALLRLRGHLPNEMFLASSDKFPISLVWPCQGRGQIIRWSKIEAHPINYAARGRRLSPLILFSRSYHNIQQKSCPRPDIHRHQTTAIAIPNEPRGKGTRRADGGSDTNAGEEKKPAIPEEA